MDSLEHFEDHERLAAKMVELGNDDFLVLGNIPLYASTIHREGGFERPMGIKELKDFFKMMGFKYLWQFIYGCYGLPYMLFEAKRSGKIGSDEGVISLS